MQATHKRLSAEQQLVHLEASALDYMVLAAAGIVPLFLAGTAIQKPNIGIAFSILYALGLLTSFVIRRSFPPNKLFHHCAWLQLIVALFISFNLGNLNGMLPDGGFDPRLFVPAYLCFLMCLGSFFYWSDSPMMFMTVPGVALFGILSWLETSGFFEVSLILFMASVAVLLTRLHLRSMYASARAAGATDLPELHRGPWRAVAGPFLAILTILAVAGFSWFVAPMLGSAARAAVGNPTLNFTPPTPRATQGSGVVAQRTIGNGPSSSSNREIVKVKADILPPYVRTTSYDSYRRTGWNEAPSVREVEPSANRPATNLRNPRVYTFELPRQIARGRIVDMFVRSASGGHTYAPVPGPVIQFEYEGNISIDRRQFIVLSDGFPVDKQFFVRAQWQMPTAEMLRAATPASERSPTFSPGFDVIDPRVIAQARELVVGRQTDYDVILAMMDFIADRCRYNLNAEAITGDKDRVAEFLFETREGYCDLFASSLAVMLRSVGINARVVIGFRITDAPDAEGWVTIRDRNAHMWTEVYFEEYGWIPFDVTDMAQAVPGGELGTLLDEEEGLAGVSWAMKAAGIIFGSAALILIIAFAVGALRSRNSITGTYRKLRPSYLVFLRVIAKQLKRPKMPSETTRQFAIAYRDAAGNGEIVLDIANKFESAFYAADEPTHEQIETIRSSVDKLVAAVRNGNGR